MRWPVTLWAVVLTLPVGGCMAKPRHLVYPDGVKFIGWHAPDFEVCLWSRDPNNPRPCPLTVHLPAGDLGHQELSDAAALKRAGWEEQSNGGSLLLRTPAAQVCCSYQGGQLVGVSVSTLPGAGGGPAAVGLGGKRASIPATDESITAALGPPLRRD